MYEFRMQGSVSIFVMDLKVLGRNFFVVNVQVRWYKSKFKSSNVDMTPKALVNRRGKSTDAGEADCGSEWWAKAKDDLSDSSR